VGVFRRAHVYQEAQLAFRDSTIFGTGAYVLREYGKGEDYHIEAERILPTDLIVDENECADRAEPDNWYLRRCIPVKRALRLYAKKDEAKAKLIQDAAGKQPMSWPGAKYVPKQFVVVVEAWHIDKEGGSEGTHTLAVEGGILKTEKWEHPWAPIVVLYWSCPLSGFYGDGVAYRQYGRQKRINYLYRWVQRCQDMVAVPRVWVDAVNGPLKVQISNEIGEIVGYRGQKPEFQTPQAVGPEIYNWLNQLESGGFEDEGISQASANNVLPPGIESAPAQRELTFKEGTRFAPVSQRWEDKVARETAEKSLALYRAHYLSYGEEYGSPKVSWSSKALCQLIDWDKVDLETEQYEIRVEASSLADLSPAGRIQAVIELAQTGWIEPEEGRRLMGHPDLIRSDEKGTAPQQHAEWLSGNLKKGVYIPPNIYGDLKLQEETVSNDLLLAEMGGADKTPDGRKAMMLMRQFLRDIDPKINPPASQLPLMPGEPGGPGPQGGIPPNPAMSLPAAQGLPPMAGIGQSTQGF
jgi:hypothetical protein